MSGFLISGALVAGPHEALLPACTLLSLDAAVRYIQAQKMRLSLAGAEVGSGIGPLIALSPGMIDHEVNYCIVHSPANCISPPCIRLVRNWDKMYSRIHSAQKFPNTNYITGARERDRKF